VPVVLTAALAATAGCSSSDDWSEPRAQPTAIGSVPPGFAGTTPPPPESTITPAPGSWDGVAPPAGYRVALLTYGDDDQTRTLVGAIRAWADEHRVSLKTVRPASPHDFIGAITRAIDLHPDLVISAGERLVDPLAAVTASHLGQHFLVVGAELAEPTHNVTAADWSGASFRGEGLGMSSSYDPATFTPERAGRALRAGVAAVLSDVTGIVVWVA